MPDIKVIILTMHENPEYLRTARLAGARGFILKDVSSNDMVRAIEAIANGGEAYSPTFDRISNTEGVPDDGMPLTTRGTHRLAASGQRCQQQTCRPRT